MSLTLLHGDALGMLRSLPDGSAQTCVTSPPYWGLRDYGAEGQLGLEATPDEYVANMVAVFREVRRVLAKDGTLWLNLGDSYASDTKGSGGTGKSGLRRDGRDESSRLESADLSISHQKFSARRLNHGLKPKDLVGIPWLVAFALRADGWYLRSDIVWSKPNPMPESIRDRPTKAHEYVFLLAKSERYYYAADAIKEQAKFPEGPWGRTKARPGVDVNGGNQQAGRIPGVAFRNKRTVWTIRPKPFRGAHFATMPPALARPCVLAGSRPSDTVLDPFNGAGTTGLVALSLGRSYVGIDVNAGYLTMTRKRLAQIEVELFKEGSA